MTTSLHLTKYVTVQDPAGKIHPIIFPMSIQHSTMVPAGFRAHSAGFFTLAAGDVTIIAIGSTSLNLDPRPEDKAIVSHLINVPKPKPEPVSTVSPSPWSTTNPWYPQL